MNGGKDAARDRSPHALRLARRCVAYFFTPAFFCICSAAALETSINVSFRLPMHFDQKIFVGLRKISLDFSRSTSSISIISRAPSRSRNACPVRGSAIPPSIAAALRVRKSTSI